MCSFGKAPRRTRQAQRKSTQPLKTAGEDAAAQFLQNKGFSVVARNWRARFGELDLVAMEGSTLVFVEVKTRHLDDFLDPALAVDRRKQVRVRRLAQAFLMTGAPEHCACRFDVVSVVGKERLSVRHIPNAF